MQTKLSGTACAATMSLLILATGARAAAVPERSYSLAGLTADKTLVLFSSATPGTTREVKLAGLTEPPILDSYTYYAVDLAGMITALAEFSPAQPLAFEARLIAAARGHSAWMKSAGLQSHDETDPVTGALLNTTGQRIDATGYPWVRFGESIFAFAESEEHGHAGFVVDWGEGPGGVQNPPGHRISNFRPEYREVGIGVLSGNGPNDTGPQFVTLEFAAQRNPPPLVTGVIYHDLDGDGFYGLGEGVGGTTVTVSDAPAYALTAGSGGYVVPSADGARTVSVSWRGGLLGTLPITVRGGTNVKADLVLPYRPPVLTGSATPSLGQPNSYTFNEIPGATSYLWRTLVPKAAPTLNAEDGLSRLLTNLDGTPFPLIARGGGWAYHLTHHASVSDQVLEVDAWVRPGAGGQVRFDHRLGYAGEIQVASLEVMTENVGTWKPVWSIRGDGGSGAGGFTTETVPLAEYSGHLVRFRFLYSLRPAAEPKTYFDQPDAAAGLLLDDIQFLDAEEIMTTAPQPVAGGSPVVVIPDQLQPFELSIRPVRSQGFWPWGPNRVLTPTVGPAPAPVVSGVVLEPDGRVHIEFTMAGGLSATPTLLRAPYLGSAFVPVPATLSTNSPGNYRFQFLPEGAQGFLRVGIP